MAGGPRAEMLSSRACKFASRSGVRPRGSGRPTRRRRRVGGRPPHIDFCPGRGRRRRRLRLPAAPSPPGGRCSRGGAPPGLALCHAGARCVYMYPGQPSNNKRRAAGGVGEFRPAEAPPAHLDRLGLSKGAPRPLCAYVRPVAMATHTLPPRGRRGGGERRHWPAAAVHPLSDVRQPGREPPPRSGWTFLLSLRAAAESAIKISARGGRRG